MQVILLEKIANLGNLGDVVKVKDGWVQIAGSRPKAVEEMKAKLGSDSAHLEIQFPYFIDKKAPVSGASSLMEYQCEFSASMTDRLDFVLGIKVPLTSLCPCSRELSRFGAHNQRSQQHDIE